MFSDIPNMAYTFGYTNASWTLRADLSHRLVCKVLHHLDDRGLGALLEVGEGRLVGDVEDVEEVVRDAAPLVRWELVGPDVHAAVELHGVGVDDLPTQSVGQCQRERGLPGAARADHGDRPQRWGHSRHVPTK